MHYVWYENSTGERAYIYELIYIYIYIERGWDGDMRMYNFSPAPTDTGTMVVLDLACISEAFVGLPTNSTKLQVRWMHICIDLILVAFKISFLRGSDNGWKVWWTSPEQCRLHCWSSSSDQQTTCKLVIWELFTLVVSVYTASLGEAWEPQAKSLTDTQGMLAREEFQ